MSIGIHRRAHLARPEVQIRYANEKDTGAISLFLHIYRLAGTYADVLRLVSPLQQNGYAVSGTVRKYHFQQLPLIRVILHFIQRIRLISSECRNGESLVIAARRTPLLMGQGIKTSVWCDCNTRIQLPTKFSNLFAGCPWIAVRDITRQSKD
jgi:hypothetical protein